MRDQFFDLSAWKRTMDGWRLTVNGHTVDLCELPQGYFTPVVDWRAGAKSFPGAPCADLRAAVEYAWPLVAGSVGTAAPPPA
jgi:hypothetical protein